MSFTSVTIRWEILDYAMFHVSEYLLAGVYQETSRLRVTYTASGYCLKTAFDRVHADISAEITKLRQVTLGRNILNLGQA